MDKLISSLGWLVESGMTRNKTKAVIKLAIQTADGQPTVDAEPVRHGHWELSPFDGNWTCSKCGDKPCHSNMKNMNCCPNCGAKMDEERGKLMTNAEAFRNDFGFYPTELWEMTEAEYLEWLNEKCDRGNPNAVEIVRCKDCKHYGTDGNCLNCNVFCCSMPKNGFCSMGERREDADK